MTVALAGRPPAVLALVSITLLAASARAQEAPAAEGPTDPATEVVPPPPPAQPPPALLPAPPPPAIQQAVPQPPPRFEAHLAGLQVLAAVATPIIAFRLAMATDSQQPGVWVGAVLTPLALGTAVCAIGSASATYEGACEAAIGGAFLGALTTIPLFYLGASMGGSGDAPFGPAVTLGAVGWFFVQPAISLLCWHRTRHLRPVPAVTTSLPPRPARGLAAPPGQVVAPLLALSF